MGVVVFNIFENDTRNSKVEDIPYSEFLKLVDQDKINDVSMIGRTITGHLDDGTNFSTFTPPNDISLIDRLSSHNVIIKAAPEEAAVSPLLGLFLNWLPMLLFI